MLNDGMTPFAAFLILILTIATHLAEVLAFPAYGSLAGLSEEELARIIPTLNVRPVPPPPAPLRNDPGVPVLVNDADHPYQPPGPNDIRGPCPGLNTLANHGYLPRNGVASPGEIIRAVQQGFNMAQDLAELVVYAAHLGDGNVLTDQLSIGSATSGSRGLNYHGTFEGDVSMTRNDAYFGDNWSFNETLFQEMVTLAEGSIFRTFNVRVAAQHRLKRIRDGIANNPEFAFNHIRYPAGYAESVFTYLFFGNPLTEQVDMDTARSFFQHGKMPANFFRRPIPVGMLEIAAHVTALWAQYPIVLPGHNTNGVNTYHIDITSPTLITWCFIYVDYVENVVVKLYPNPQGQLREALKRNLIYFHRPFGLVGCPPIFPYGLLKDDEPEVLVDQNQSVQAPVSTGRSIWSVLVQAYRCWVA